MDRLYLLLDIESLPLSWLLDDNCVLQGTLLLCWVGGALMGGRSLIGGGALGVVGVSGCGLIWRALGVEDLCGRIRIGGGALGRDGLIRGALGVMSMRGRGMGS